MYSFPNLEPVCCSMSSSNCCFLTWIQISRRQVRLSGIPISWRIFQFVVIHTVKGFGIVNKAEVDVYLELLFFRWSKGYWEFDLCFLCLFLNPAWTSGISQFTYHWSLAWRILSITLLACEMMQLCGSLSILWHCLSLGLEWNLIFSSPVATGEFSKFADILSAALSQHHLLGFEIVRLEFHHFLVAILPKARLASHSRI